jgi:hypothetical protein
MFIFVLMIMALELLVLLQQQLLIGIYLFREGITVLRALELRDLLALLALLALKEPQASGLLAQQDRPGREGLKAPRGPQVSGLLAQQALLGLKVLLDKREKLAV